MDEKVRVKYTGSALPGNAETVVLFSTVAAFPGAQYLAQRGLERFCLSLVNDQAGTLKAYFSDNRGVSWTQIDNVAVAIAPANEDQVYDFGGLPGFQDWKLEWVNGATPQTTFKPNMYLTTERGPLA